jgi:hypothetical protein
MYARGSRRRRVDVPLVRSDMNYRPFDLVTRSLYFGTTVAGGVAAATGGAAAWAFAFGISATGEVPFTLAFCRVPIVCRACRVAARFCTAADFVAVFGICRAGRVMPKSASVLGSFLN